MRHQNGLLIDIETIPDDRAFDWVEPAGNLVDPIKKAASVREKQDKLATDPNGCRIVAIGLWRLHQGEWSEGPSVDYAVTLEGERRMLSAWRDRDEEPGDLRIFGFCARTFDAPVLMRRAQILRIPFPRWSLARYGKGDVIDLYEEATWHDTYFSKGVLSQSLESFARILDLPPVDDPGDGSLVWKWFKDGELGLIQRHCEADLYRAAHLGYRLGLWAEPPLPPAVEAPIPAPIEEPEYWGV